MSNTAVVSEQEASIAQAQRSAITDSDMLVQGTLYQRIIDTVIEASRTDFEENGIDHRTLEQLREVSQVTALYPLASQMHCPCVQHPHICRAFSREAYAYHAMRCRSSTCQVCDERQSGITWPRVRGEAAAALKFECERGCRALLHQLYIWPRSLAMHASPA